MRNIVGYVVMCLWFAGSICGIVFGVMYFNLKPELKSVSEYIQTIEELQQRLTIFETANQALETNLEIALERHKDDEEQLELKVTIIAEKENRIEELEQMLSEETENKEALISEKVTLQNEVSDLKEESEVLKSQLKTSSERINSLELAIENYQIEINRLLGLLAGYEEIKNGVHEVSFFVNDIETYTLPVKHNQTIEKEPIVSDTNQYRFDGWSFEPNGQIVDVTTFVITEPINFYAILTEKFKVTFVDGEVVFDTQYILKGSYVENVPEPEKEDYSFSHWVYNIGFLYENYVIFEKGSVSITKDLTVEARWNELPRTGLYDIETDKKIKTWAELLSEDYLKLSASNVLTAGSKSKQIEGNLYIAEGVVEIGASCFSGCLGLKRIKIPDSVVKISKLAFKGCTSLKSIYIPKTVTSIYGGVYGSDNVFFECLSTLIIYCGVSSRPSGYNEYWSCYKMASFLTVKWGYSFTEYFLDARLNGTY